MRYLTAIWVGSLLLLLQAAAPAALKGWESTEGTLWSLAKSADGRYLAAGAAAGFVQIFDPQSLEPVQRIPAWGKAIFGLAFSPDSQILAACDNQGRVNLFNTQTWQLQDSLRPGSGCERLAFSAQGQLAIVGTPSQPVTHHALWLYAVAERKLSAPLVSSSSAQRYLSALDFSPDGRQLAVGSSNRQHGIEVFQVQGQRLSSVRRLTTGADVLALHFSPNGQFLAAGGTDQRLGLWKWQTGQRFWSVAWRSGNAHYLTALDFAPDGQQIASCGMGKGTPVQLYRTGNGAQVGALGDSKRMNCTGVRFDQAGTHLFVIRQVFSNFNETVLARYALP